MLLLYLVVLLFTCKVKKNGIKINDAVATRKEKEIESRRKSSGEPRTIYHDAETRVQFFK